MSQIDDILIKSGATDYAYFESDESVTFSFYKEWLQKGHHGNLNYLADHRADIRSSLKKFYPDFKSGIIFSFSYAQTSFALQSFYRSSESNGLKISSYALGFEGQDYHEVLGKKLIQIGEELKKLKNELEYKMALDIHPVLERDIAVRAGLGWFGKNSMFISRHHGSFQIIGTLLFNQTLSLPFKKLETDHCGTCRACIDACPTAAIDLETRTIAAKLCISHFTIEEFKEVSAPSGMENGKGEIFGCDICQDVCPWNKKLLKHFSINQFRWNTKALEVIDFYLKTPLYDLINKIEKMSNKEFKNKFLSTSFERLGKKGMLKNLKFYSKDSLPGNKVD